jgi:hypothetical protein
VAPWILAANQVKGADCVSPNIHLFFLNNRNHHYRFSLPQKKSTQQQTNQRQTRLASLPSTQLVSLNSEDVIIEMIGKKVAIVLSPAVGVFRLIFLSKKMDVSHV